MSKKENFGNDEMFTISNTVVTTLQGFFEAFAREGIAKVPNEDKFTNVTQDYIMVLKKWYFRY